MDKIKVLDKTFKPFIPNARIEEAIDGVALKLNEDFGGRDEVPTLLCVLNGAIAFTASLMKRLDFDCELMSLKVSSYAGTHSTGNVNLVMNITGDITGKTVIICEDIVDTGNTVVALKKLLLEKGAKEVRICTMLLKPEIYSKDEHIDYVGMEIPNAFIVGYGLDYDEIGRQYKDIYVIDE